MELRPYQRALVEECSALFRAGWSTVCLQSGTGSGKTHTASAVIERVIARGQRCVFLAHLDSLIEDTHERLAAMGVPCGFIQAGRPSDPTAPVQVASIQTLLSRGDRPPAHLLIPDECHRTLAAGYRDLIEAYPGSAILGLTATPQRGDGRPLGKASGGIFEKLVPGPSNRWLTENGFLVPCDVLAPDGYASALAVAPVDAYMKFTPFQRGIFFCANHAHADEVFGELVARGVECALIVADTPREERRRLRAEFAAGRVRAIVGVSVFLEGWDVPSIEVVVLGRAFGVCAAYLQGIGRGLRPSPDTGKTRCTVLDLRGAFALHGLPDEDRVWSLEGRAVRRAETTTAIARCKHCLAVFRPQTRCPRCGAEMRGEPKLPRVLSRAEKLANVSKLPQSERDRRYLDALTRRAFRIGFRKSAALAWARARFVEKFHREPECVG